METRCHGVMGDVSRKLLELKDIILLLLLLLLFNKSGVSVKLPSSP